ncbi:MAG: LysM peptidoglycan-binding domain-containing protein [Pelagimonas sp.]|uniref:LysM peptidoglycan-binding domain-containing protein n=1 Tax=Pelagimonas sp. TaxID=2073170 RepID=UPI003D6B6164
MIRMVLLALGFVVVTVALVVLQPGSGRRADQDPLPEPVVTRAEPALSAPVPDQQPAGVSQLPPAPVVSQTQRPVVVAAPQGDMDDQSLRKMTWQTLSSLNHATGRESAPGQPGSLLHTIVRRSLDEAPNGAVPTATVTPQVYVVQTGDSLVSIAERIYGDVNMTGPLFAANQTILSRPDDLRAGQTLILPIK